MARRQDILPIHANENRPPQSGKISKTIGPRIACDHLNMSTQMLFFDESRRAGLALQRRREPQLLEIDVSIVGGIRVDKYSASFRQHLVFDSPAPHSSSRFKRPNGSGRDLLQI